MPPSTTPLAEIGRAEIDPGGDVTAGSHGTWRLTYRAGSAGVAAGGWVRIYTDSDTDWEWPQVLDPAAADFARVEGPDGVRLALRVESQRAVRLLVSGRALNEGEQISLILGDTRGGGAGSRAQTFVEEQRFFWFDVDARADGNAVTLPDPPLVRIVGDAVVRLVVTAPSTVAVGQKFRVLVKAEDRWGNPTASYDGKVELSGEGMEWDKNRRVDFSQNSLGAAWLDGLSASRAGVLTLTARDGELSAHSNPILAGEHSREYPLFWADPHGGQLVLNSKITHFYRHARDMAGVQFVGYQRNADAMSAEDWSVQQQQEREYDEPGVFVPIPGFEWSGRTWEGGHHNVYFRRHGQPARRNLPVEEMFNAAREAGELAHINQVYDAYRGSDVTITPHVGGEHSDLNHHEPSLEPAVEIVSSHGMFEWMLRDALTRGYRLGFLGGSDSYTARPGDDRPGHQMRRYSKAGLTGIYAKEISLAAFHEAMKARRVYATTGARMILHTEVDGQPLGSELTVSAPPTISARVNGTGPLEAVELFRGLERIHAVDLDRPAVPNQVRLLWRGASRMTSYSGVVWDGQLRIRGGTIACVSTLRFDSPRSRLIEQTGDMLRWQAWGCGYPMGLIIDLNDATDAQFDIAVQTQTITGPAYGDHGSRPPRRISFAPAESATMQVAMNDLAHGASELQVGVLERQLQMSPGREPGPTTAEFTYTDDWPKPGVNPYWLRVTQADQEFGWTSPVFVDYCP